MLKPAFIVALLLVILIFLINRYVQDEHMNNQNGIMPKCTLEISKPYQNNIYYPTPARKKDQYHLLCPNPTGYSQYYYQNWYGSSRYPYDKTVFGPYKVKFPYDPKSSMRKNI